MEKMEKKQKNYKQCNICKVNEATSLCSQCFSYYCDKCFKYVHEMKENKEHKKESIDYNIPIDICCPNHERNPLNLFCLNEKGILYYNITIYSTLLCLLSI